MRKRFSSPKRLHGTGAIHVDATSVVNFVDEVGKIRGHILEGFVVDNNGATSMIAEAALAPNILSIFDLDQIPLD